MDHANPDLETLSTPCLLLDRGKLESNTARMRDRIAGMGAAFRPHLKSAKSVEAANFVLGSPPGPATVSTLEEAEIFGESDITDLLYAVCISPQKLARVTAMRGRGIDLKIILDSEEMAQSAARHAAQSGDPIPTLIEIDVDDHRSGVRWDDSARLIRIGMILAEVGALRGILCHAGESYNLHDPTALATAAEEERARMASAAKALRDAGLPCPVVSVGATPTALSSRSYDGITEVRAGVYMFFDLVQAGIGVCGIGDIALSVLATVIGHQPQKGWIITDAGWMALSADRGTKDQAVDQYAGLVCDINGQPYPDLVVLRANQEHGILAARPGSGARIPELRVGDRVRILPNHACATAAQHDRYHVIDGGNRVEAVWPRFRGW
ncbi:MAG TPA: alanine racemase [Rhizomicrobium sp.]|jgi:D-serine deaminase-like pyridoxal phosphate-dependent protein